MSKSYGEEGPHLKIGWGTKKPTTGSGKAIPSAGSKKYSGVTWGRHAKDYVAAAHTHGPKIAGNFSNYTKQDHLDAAAHHEDNNDHHVAGAHFALAGHYNGRANENDPIPRIPKLAKSLSKAAAKGEGSRGGHIIGHTKSGSAIYSHDHELNAQGARGGAGAADLADDHKYPAAAKMLIRRHKNYTAQDHLDAAHAHQQHAQEFGNNGQIAMTGPESRTASSRSSRDREITSQRIRKLGRAHQAAAMMKHAADKAQKSMAFADRGSHGFDDMLKASGITMWAPKPNRAELARLN